jgi:hypothetical protein
MRKEDNPIGIAAVHRVFAFHSVPPFFPSPFALRLPPFTQ